MKGVRVVIEICSCSFGNHSRPRGQQHHELPSNICERIAVQQISLLRHTGVGGSYCSVHNYSNYRVKYGRHFFENSRFLTFQAR
jgi:hypothetical protein